MAKDRRQSRYLAANLLNTFTPGTNDTDMASMLGVSRSCVVQWRTRRTEICEYRADKYAIKLGFHPFEVWNNWLDEVNA